MEKINKRFVIAIDGKAATGKTVLAKAISQKLNILYIDTGAMYRAVGLYFKNNDLEINDENIAKNINNIDVRLEVNNGITKVYLNDKEVSQDIRTSDISWAASVVSKYKLVREKLVQLQRQMANNQSVVLEGRDIGSVVFPEATLKIFLVASVDIRAKRRKKDLANKGEDIDLETVKADLEKRDLQDSTRKESPLIKTEDAIEIDTTPLTNDETVEIIIKLLNERIEI